METTSLHTELASDGVSQLAALARWQSECAGNKGPSAELRVLQRRFGWTRQEISLCFEALAGMSVRPAVGRYLVDRELTPTETARLTDLWLIRLDRDGWALTRKAEEMLGLMAACSNPPQPSPHQRATLWNYI